MSQQMLPAGLSSLLSPFVPLFTAPTFAYFCQWVLTMMLAEGRKCATRVWAHGPRTRHFTNYSRFLSRYRWSWEQLAQALAGVVWDSLPWPHGRGRPGRLYVAVDDTVAPKSGRRQPGVAYHFHHNATGARSFVKGHCWVILGALFWLGERVLCFPLRAELYIRAKDCAQDFRDKIQIALDLLQAVRWPAQAQLTVMADGAFAVRKFLTGVRARGHHIITRLKHNAQVHLPLAPALRKRRGRPRKYGPKLHLPTWSQDPRNGRRLTLRLYGQRVTLWLGTMDLVPRVLGEVARIVVVKVPKRPVVVLMCTDLSLSAKEILRRYCGRFSIEITFRELKQTFGFGDYQVRSREAILRHVHLSFTACCLLHILLVRLTLCRAGGLRSLLAQPWRDPAQPLTLGQTRLLLQHLCALESLGGQGIFSTSAAHVSYRKNHLRRLRAAFAQRKCAEL